MRTVTIDVCSAEEAMGRFKRAWTTGEPQEEFVSFVTPELLWKTLTQQRSELLMAMAGKGPMSLRAAARLVGRDVKTVHGDVHLLLDAGLLEKDQDGKIVFVYDALHVDFTIRAAA